MSANREEHREERGSRGTRHTGPSTGPLARVALSVAFLLAVCLGVPGTLSAQGSGQCAGPVADGGASLNGFVVAGGVPLPGAEVLVRWSAYDGGSSGEVMVPTDQTGQYSVCGLPAGVQIDLAATALGQQGQPVSVTLEEGATRRRDLEVSMAGRSGSGGTAGGSSGGRPRPRILGRVLAGAKGQPAGGATIRLEPVGRTLEADSVGDFTFEDLQPGTYALNVSHPEHGRRTDSVSVDRGGSVQVLVRLGELPAELEPVKVTVRDARLEQAGFYERMERGLGYFITPQILEQRRPARLYQAFSMVPGVRIERVCENQRCVNWPVMTGVNCLPIIYVDGSEYNVQVTEGLRSFNPTSIAAIEVFRGASEVPDVYSGSQARCGVVALWRK